MPGGSVTTALFDAGGVLLLPDPDAFRKVTAPLGVVPDDETCSRAHYAGMREVDRLGTADWRAVDHVVARALGVDGDDVESLTDAISNVYLSTAWLPIPGAAETLVRLAAAGFNLAVVSNATGTVEEQLATHEVCSVDGGTCARVAVVVDSHVVGVEKPDPAIFAIAFEALGVEPGECVYVGDTVHFDVRGAEAAGVRPLHLDPFGLCPDSDHEHLAAITDVPDVLARLAG